MFHKQGCFKCHNCAKALELGKQTEKEGNVFCKTCYGRLFGPRGYHTEASFIAETGIEKDGSAKNYVINTTVSPRSSGAEPRKTLTPPSGGSRPMSMAVSGPGNTCAVCSKTVGFAEKFSGLGVTYHRDCARCKTCSKKITPGEFTSKDNALYCKTCYARNFGPKGHGFGGVVGHHERGSGAEAASPASPAAPASSPSKRASTARASEAAAAPAPKDEEWSEEIDESVFEDGHVAK